MEDTVRLADRIQLYLSSPSRYPAVYKKYESKKFMKVAGFVADWILKQDSQFDSHATTLDVSAENESVTLCESGDDSE